MTFLSQDYSKSSRLFQPMRLHPHYRVVSTEGTCPTPPISTNSCRTIQSLGFICSSRRSILPTDITPTLGVVLLLPSGYLSVGSYPHLRFLLRAFDHTPGPLGRPIPTVAVSALTEHIPQCRVPRFLPLTYRVSGTHPLVLGLPHSYYRYAPVVVQYLAQFRPIPVKDSPPPPSSLVPVPFLPHTPHSPCHRDYPLTEGCPPNSFIPLNSYYPRSKELTTSSLSVYTFFLLITPRECQKLYLSNFLCLLLHIHTNTHTYIYESI